mmetsp:Transcript_2082/g.7446  ORF Transcript_2082/g.7446 Transcript_2082/m.7446 type:complete len:216 (-) Transcript_2082:925-1572(-)
MGYPLPTGFVHGTDVLDSLPSEVVHKMVEAASVAMTDHGNFYPAFDDVLRELQNSELAELSLETAPQLRVAFDMILHVLRGAAREGTPYKQLVADLAPFFRTGSEALALLGKARKRQELKGRDGSSCARAQVDTLQAVQWSVAVPLQSGSVSVAKKGKDSVVESSAASIEEVTVRLSLASTRPDGARFKQMSMPLATFQDLASEVRRLAATMDLM